MALQINKANRAIRRALQCDRCGDLTGYLFIRRRLHLPACLAGTKTDISRRLTIPIPTSKPNGGITQAIWKPRAAKSYGYQVTFFRFGVRDRQKETKESPLFTELYMAHFALSDMAAKKFTFRERINRGYETKAGAATDRYLVWNEDWKVEGDEKVHHRFKSMTAARSSDLSLKSLKPPVLARRERLKSERRGRRTSVLLLFVDAHANRRRVDHRRQEGKSPRPELDGPRVRQQSTARRSGRLGLV